MTPSLPEVSSGGSEALPRPRGTASAGCARRSGRSDLPGENPARARLAGLSIVLPCFNEAANLPEVVERALAVARSVSEQHEVIVVDDGSTDGSRDVAAGLAEERRGVRLVLHLTNRGYGAAVRTGIHAATLPYVLIAHADLRLDLRELERFVPELERCDVVVGYRLRRRDPAARRGGAAAWNALVSTLYGLDLRDVNCGFKLFPRELLESLELGATGAMVDTELLVKALAHGATVTEVAVHHYPRRTGRSRSGSPRVVARAVRELAQLHGSLWRLARSSSQTCSGRASRYRAAPSTSPAASPRRPG